MFTPRARATFLFSALGGAKHHYVQIAHESRNANTYACKNMKANPYSSIRKNNSHVSVTNF